MRRVFAIAIWAAFAAASLPAFAQTDSQTQAAAPASGIQVLDQVEAIVNHDVILESDIEEEMRFAAFEPFSNPSDEDSRQTALSRLINRALIQQQMVHQPNPPVISDAALNTDLEQLRKTLPSCAAYHCETQQGWDEFCTAHGFTPAQVATHWRLRMTILAFIEQRFRAGIRISRAETEEYYQKTFLPEFAEQHTQAPPLDSVAKQINEVLLEQHVTALLDDWLQSLRAEGDIVILNPADIPPPNAPMEDAP
jgi:peptidyl-prolyl cis-trans isomerase SurA